MAAWSRLNPHRQRRVDLLRRTGACAFALCVALAIFVYRIGVANHQPTLQELVPESAKAIERNRGILFGRTGITMLDWLDTLQEPAGMAFLLVIAGVIAAAAFYQVAHRIEVEEG
jgi:hypothetical protein